MAGFSNRIMFSNPRVKLIRSPDTDNACRLKGALKNPTVKLLFCAYCGIFKIPRYQKAVFSVGKS